MPLPVRTTDKTIYVYALEGDLRARMGIAEPVGLALLIEPRGWMVSSGRAMSLAVRAWGTSV